MRVALAKMNFMGEVGSIGYCGLGWECLCEVELSYTSVGIIIKLIGSCKNLLLPMLGSLMFMV